MTLLLEDKHAVVCGGRWFRYVTGPLEQPPRLKTPKSNDPAAGESTPAFAA
ncbi:MAG: hypothetical protein H0U04_18815 [Rubrobacter sp.]|nr:hypothetical protein [Rubrobacter sp.]